MLRCMLNHIYLYEKVFNRHDGTFDHIRLIFSDIQKLYKLQFDHFDKKRLLEKSSHTGAKGI